MTRPPIRSMRGATIRLVLQWNPGETAAFHDVYFGTNPTPGSPEFRGRQPSKVYWQTPGLTPGTTYYWRVDEVEADGTTIYEGDVWSFTTAPLTACKPSPIDGAKFIDGNPVLTWSPGLTALTHDVYFGTNEADVAAGTAGAFRGNQITTTYDPGTLAENTTYYWRIDECDSIGTYKGEVWSFTTMRAGGGLRADYYEGMNFEKFVLTRIEPQVNFNWRTSSADPDYFSIIWTGQIDVAFSEPYIFNFSSNDDDGFRLWLDGRLIIDTWQWHLTHEERRSQPVELNAGQLYSIQVQFYQQGWSAVAQLYWESPHTPRQIVPQAAFSPPVKAFRPEPANGATGVKHTYTLSWEPAHQATLHLVYFGENFEDVNTGTADTFKGQQPDATYTPGPLELDKVYYWRVDEFDGSQTRKGDVWSFSTQFWPDVYTAGSGACNTDSKIVSVGFFHWFDHRGSTTGACPWPPLDGAENWNGQVEFWKGQIKQVMAANIDIMYVLLIDDYPSHHYEQSRVNLFKALNEMRAVGYNVPKVMPFLDPVIIWLCKDTTIDLATTEGKDELVSHYTRWFDQYYSVNQDPYADDYIAVMNWAGTDRPMLSTWGVCHLTNLSSFTRSDLESRLAMEFASAHPLFNNGIYIVTTYHPPTFTFSNEKMWMFEGAAYYTQIAYNGLTAVTVMPGFWNQNFLDPGYFLARDGGVHYENAWNRVLAEPSVDRVHIVSWNETGEGSGLYAADPGPPYIRPDMNNPNTDIWSDANDPFEYIKTTAAGARLFNDRPDYASRILWHNIPTKMYPGEKRRVQVVVRNEGDLMWNNANNFRFGQKEFLPGEVLFAENGQNRWSIDEVENEVSLYGGIFRGRALRFIMDLVAPNEPGEYVTHWGMLQEPQMWFGQELVATINVVPMGPERTLALDLASHADLHVYDGRGRHIGVNYQTNTVEQNIPGASFKILDEAGNEVPYGGSMSGEGLHQVVNLRILATGSYQILLVGTSDGPYKATINGLRDGTTVASKTYRGDIASGKCLMTTVAADLAEDTLILVFEDLVYMPVLGVEPSKLEVTGQPNSVQEAVLVVGEMTGKATLHSVSIRCTDIVGRGVTIKGSDVAFDLNNFDVAPGGQQVVHAYIPVTSGFSEKASGSIVVESADGGTKSIAVTVKPAKRYPPVADAGGPYEGVVGQAIRFDASGSYDPDGEIVWYGWYLDGWYYGSNVAVWEHTLYSEFSGTVTLFVTDDEGRASVATTTVVVNPAP